MFFPLFSSSRGTEVCQYGQLSSNHPLKLSLWWSWGTPALHCGRHQPQPRTTLQIYSDKLVYAAEWMSKTKYFLGRRKQKRRSRKKSSLKGGGRKSHDEKRWGQVFAQARLGFWWGLFPVRPGKCGPQLSRLMKATTCSSLKASLCFLAASSCSSAHTICHGEVNTNTITKTTQQTTISTFKSNNMCFNINVFCVFLFEYYFKYN